MKTHYITLDKEQSGETISYEIYKVHPDVLSVIAEGVLSAKTNIDEVL